MEATAIVFTVGIVAIACVALSFYCWRVGQREGQRRGHHLGSAQVSATPEEVPVNNARKGNVIGLKKDVIDAFPTVKASELKKSSEEKLQCPICLVEYGDGEEVLRQLPYCRHVFHIRCVDSWIQKQSNCPVCRVVLTEKAVKQQAWQHPLQSTPTSYTMEVQAEGPPSWVLVNRPLPLPRAEIRPTTLAKNSRDSFSFKISGSDDFERTLDSSLALMNQVSSSRHDGKQESISDSLSTSSSWDFTSQAATRPSKMDSGHPGEKVYETKALDDHLPLTNSPEDYSFEFLPVVTGPGGEYSFRPPETTIDTPKVGSSHQTYSQLHFAKLLRDKLNKT